MKTTDNISSNYSGGDWASSTHIPCGRSTSYIVPALPYNHQTNNSFPFSLHLVSVCSLYYWHKISISSIKCNNFHAQKLFFEHRYCVVQSKWEFFLKMRAAFLASILPRVMKEGESKEGSSALILMKNSHFDRTLRYKFRWSKFVPLASWLNLGETGRF